MQFQNNISSSDICFFMPDVVGGVASVVNNIIKYVGKKEASRIIAYHNNSDSRSRLPASFNENILLRFEYAANNNVYYTCKKLKRVLPGSESVIVATDALELQMVNICKLDNKVVMLVLGDFDHYYEIAVKYQGIVNGFIAISRDIYSTLIQRMPARQNDIHLAYFPTPPVEGIVKSNGNTLRALFIGRLDDTKNPLLLPVIDDLLRDNGVTVQWTIVGDGPLLTSLKELTRQRGNFSCVGLVKGENLPEYYSHNDLFIMTSLSEGLPVSLIDAMKSGLIPVISNIPGGIRDVVQHGINGFLCNTNDEHAFAEAITIIAKDRSSFQTLATNAKNNAVEMFDPYANSKRYFELINSISYSKNSKKFITHPGNILDRQWLPNNLVKWLRNMKDRNKQHYAS